MKLHNFRLYTFVLIIILVSPINFSTSELCFAQTNTEVGGILVEDTIWTLEDSPYTLAAHILVSENVILTVEAGVEVNLDGHFIQVNGSIQILGVPENPVKVFDTENTSWDKIVFSDVSTPWNEQDGTGCIIKNTIIEGSAYASAGLICIKGSSPLISNSTILNTNFSGDTIVINGGIATIEGCYISGYIGIILWQGSATIKNNVVVSRGMGNSGIFIRSRSRSPHEITNVEGNSIHYFETGIIAEIDYLPVNIVRNEISMNEQGIRVELGEETDSDLLLIDENAIHKNQNWNVLAGIIDSDMTNNWWGTVNSTEIEEKIYDFDQDFRLGNITYEPFLTSAPSGIVDNTPPITTHNFTYGWHNTDFLINLTATDDRSGTRATFYKINNSYEQDTRYNGQPLIAESGQNITLEYWSVDAAGNEEAHKILSGIQLDENAPFFEPKLSGFPEGEIYPNQEVTVKVTVGDDLSGVSNVLLSYSTDDEITWKEISMTLNSSYGHWECKISGQSADTIVSYKFFAYDNAGNVGELNNESLWYSNFEVIPEFPSWIVLPLFLIATVLIIVSKNKLTKSN